MLNIKYMPSFTFTVCTYNIWFDNHEINPRLVSLIKVIRKVSPDILCLQEVRLDVYKVLKEQLKKYKYSYPETILKYGTVILSKYPIVKEVLYKYPCTFMNRNLPVAHIQHPNHEDIIITIANTHFESVFFDDSPIKIQQYNISKEILDGLSEDYKNIILCCDNNIQDHEEDLFFKDPNWIDSWKEKGSSEHEYTYDSQTNPHFAKVHETPPIIRSRIDRILHKSNNITVLEYTVLKNLIVPEPSDHYGVLVKYQYSTKNI